VRGFKTTVLLENEAFAVANRSFGTLHARRDRRRFLANDPVRAQHLVCEGLRTPEWASFLSPLALLRPVAVARLAEILAGS
jgi:hypothetical protein